MSDPVESNMGALWSLVASIPQGKCTNYGRLGQALPKPVSGFIVGRWMARAPDGLPWWRVVSKHGLLPIDKLNPHFAIEQRRRLEAEGVPFDGDHVAMEFCFYDPF